MANTKTATKRATAKAAQTADATEVTPAPIPATVVDSPTVASPSVAPAKTSPVAEPAGEDSKKNKPLKLHRNKAQKWLDSLKKVQEASPNKLVASVIGGIETLLAHEQNAAAKGNNRNLSGYNVFVQQNIKQVAAQNANLSNKEVMVKIAEMWQLHKVSLAQAPAVTV